MSLKIDTQNLKDVLVLFHTLTGIRLVIYDDEFQKIMAYPEEKCAFCRQMRQTPELSEKCLESDKAAFIRCKTEKDIVFYNCHAGLVECVAPIKNSRRIIGYVMFGQITDMKDKGKLKDSVGVLLNKYGLLCDISNIKYKSKRQILAASKLLEICTNYILMKDIVESDDSLIVKKVKEYIDVHLSEQIEILDLCKCSGISRTKLYDTFSKSCGFGIASYIKEVRLQKARGLLKETELSVAEVSACVGFDDYNYFSRVFKSKFGISPRNYRK